MTEEITIIIHSEGMATVVGKKMPRSRLTWYAPGLHVYVCGAMPVRTYTRICNIACNEAILRHIPAISLKRVVRTTLPQVAYDDDDYEEKLI